MAAEHFDVEELNRRGDIDGLIAALERGEPRERMRAAGFLGRLGDERAIMALAHAFWTDPYRQDDQVGSIVGTTSTIVHRTFWPVREAAASALLTVVQEQKESLSDDQVVAIAGGKPPNPSEPAWRVWMREGRRRNESPSDEETLFNLLASEGLRRDLWYWPGSSAVWLLKPEEKGDASTLITKLSDPSAHVRGAAAKHLGNLRKAEAVQPLASALKDKDLVVHRAAAKALQKLRRELHSDKRTASAITAALDDYGVNEGRRGPRLP